MDTQQAQEIKRLYNKCRIIGIIILIVFIAACLS